MNELALFAGAGGGILGGKLLGWRTVCAVEKDEYCQRVLEQRIRDGHLPEFPIWDDVRTFDGRPWRGKVDIVTAGFPCQPFSTAGKKEGENDDRNMWPETIRIIREVGPEFAFLENVPGLVRYDYFGEILGDLADAGFDAEWDIVSAANIGARHIRKRLWILCHAEQNLRSEEPRLKTSRRNHACGSCDDVSDSERRRPSGQRRPRKSSYQKADRKREANDFVNEDWWQTEPDVGRVANGVASRVDRLKAIGNGQVPAVAAVAFGLLYEHMMSGK